MLWRSSRTRFLTNHSVCLALQSRWEPLPALIWRCRPEDYLPTNSYCLQDWQMKKAKYVCFHHRSCCFPLSLDKRHLGTVPRFWKQWLSGQEPRSLKCAFFFCSFLPVSLLSLIITSVLGPMPNSSALTPQYTQAHTAEQFAVQRTRCRHVFPNQAPANHFCLQEEPLGLRMLLVSCAQLTRDTPFLHFPEKRFCGAPS